MGYTHDFILFKDTRSKMLNQPQPNGTVRGNILKDAGWPDAGWGHSSFGVGFQDGITLSAIMQGTRGTAYLHIQSWGCTHSLEVKR